MQKATQPDPSLPPDLSVRFLAVFNNNSKSATFPEISYHQSATGAVEGLKCMERTELDSAASASLHTLYPQVRGFIAKAVTHFRLAGPIANELQKAIWRAKAPAWAAHSELATALEKVDEDWTFKFKIASISATLFPTQVLIFCVDIVPTSELSDATALPAAKMLLDTFVRTGRSFSDGSFKSVPVTRVFARQEQCDSAMQRMGANSLGLIQGLCGQGVSLVDMVKGLLPDECFLEEPSGRSCESAFLMGDRFLASTFLKTNWDGQGRAFSDQDRIDLIRLSRAEDDKYEPVRDQNHSNSSSIMLTFENIAFCPSSEGVVCWVKPTAYQDFLHQQFKRDRYETVYFQLYLLALHQRYSLVNFSRRLDEVTREVEVLQQCNQTGHEVDFKNIESQAEPMKDLRTEVSLFYLRAFFLQPATLTNHHEFYRSLQRVLGVSELLDQVRQASSELDHRMTSWHQDQTTKRHQESVTTQASQHGSSLKQIARLISEQERSSKSHFLLTVVVELLTIPYYTFNFLSEAFHLGHIQSVLASIGVTTSILLCTLFYLLKKPKDHQETKAALE